VKTLYELADAYFTEPVTACTETYQPTIAGRDGAIYHDTKNDRWSWHRYDRPDRHNFFKPDVFGHVVSAGKGCSLTLKSGAQRRRRAELIDNAQRRRAIARERREQQPATT